MGFTHDHMVSFMSFLEDTLIFTFGINNIDIMKYILQYHSRYVYSAWHNVIMDLIEFGFSIFVFHVDGKVKRGDQNRMSGWQVAFC